MRGKANLGFLIPREAEKAPGYAAGAFEDERFS
jgi:hypothetical protein